MCVRACVCVHACVHECVCACMSACVRAYMRVAQCDDCEYIHTQQLSGICLCHFDDTFDPTLFVFLSLLFCVPSRLHVYKVAYPICVTWVLSMLLNVHRDACKHNVQVLFKETLSNSW